MALEAIEDRLQQTNSMRLLQLLPSAESMRWVDEAAGTPPKGLVIGTSHKQDIVAYLIRVGDKPPELRFAIAGTGRILRAEELATLKLVEPFVYLKGTSKAEKSRVSYFIKYYFLRANVVKEGLCGDLLDMAKKFHYGLVLIEQKMASLRGSDGKRQTIEDTEDDSDGDFDGERVRTRSALGARRAPSPTPRTTLEKTPSDYKKLRQILQEYDELYLLDNLPTPEEMTFTGLDDIPKAIDQKLLVGSMRGRPSSEIYAYLRPNHNHHEVRFLADDGERTLSTQEFAAQEVLHPFNKTFPKNTASMDQADRARITLVVKFYFLASGVAEGIILKETRDYPQRFRAALAYIAERMGRGAVKPPTPSAKTRTEDSELDESHIQSTLGANRSPHSLSHGSDHARTQLAQQPTPDASASATSGEAVTRKRTAEDAELDNLGLIFIEDRRLTKEMNEMDDRIDLIEMQLRALKEERAVMDEARKTVRKRLKRQSLVFVEVSSED